MADSTTRITDLPENGMPVSGGADTNYMPMNVHPNPYGNSGPQPGFQPPAPSYVPPSSGQAPPPQNIQIQFPAEMAGLPTGGEQYRLPSRDIPMNPAAITQDIEIRPNYVPPPPPATISDYVREYEDKKLAKAQEHQAKTHRAEMADDIFSELQIPLFLTILFFLFQMPFVNNLLHKYFAFAMITNADGNLNVQGLILKSVLFGSIYYAISKGVQYLTVV
jgi:hypothetical protein